jgi:hypothetical protein
MAVVISDSMSRVGMSKVGCVVMMIIDNELT